MKKFVEATPLSNPEAATRKLIEIASGVEAVQDGRIYEIKGTPAQYLAGLKHAIERGWIEMHSSGTYIRFAQAGADLFA